jgi:glycosyltransferase involved in cell wall biosynthesis
MMNFDGSQLPWILVAADFKQTGGMDKANFALATFLVSRNTPVHLVAHFVDSELARSSLVTMHLVPKPLKSYFLGEPLLDLTGRAVWRKVRKRWPAVKIVVNGSNCLAEGINWCHFVHSAWKPDLSNAKWSYRLRWRIENSWERYRERLAYRKARLVITNSDMTSRHVIDCLGGQRGERVHRVYLGADSEWGQVSNSERVSQREAYQIFQHHKVALFVGALGFDNRKGLDMILKAWKILCKNKAWDVELWVVGTGPEHSQANAFIEKNDLRDRVRLLGFRNDVRELLACANLLVSVPRYEPYGLNLQEALTRGVSVIASSNAGIAERFPKELRPLLCSNPSDVRELVEKLLLWQSNPEYWQQLCNRFGAELSTRSWTSMAEEMVDLIERDFAIQEPTAIPQRLFAGSKLS